LTGLACYGKSISYATYLKGSISFGLVYIPVAVYPPRGKKA
jgi:non-homologous end joining protein Ku